MVLRYKSLGYNVLAGEKRHMQGAKNELGITQKLLLGKKQDLSVIQRHDDLNAYTQ